MKVSELRDLLNLQLMNELFDRDIDGVFISDMVSDIVAGLSPGNLLVTIQTHKNLIASANLVDASAVVFVRGKKPLEDVIQLANRAKLTLLSTDLDAWNLALKLYEAGLR
jgi:predicted transcriptional regulator